MESFYDYKKFAILYIDDELISLKYFRKSYEGKFRVLTAGSAEEGLALFDKHKDEIGILMTDQRMPGMKGVEVLERARQIRPRIVRMMATAYADNEATVGAVNAGAIARYIPKPWETHELEQTLSRGLEFFIVQRERDQFMREKMSVLHDLVITERVVSLGILAAGLSHHLRNGLVAVRTFLDLVPAKLVEEKDIESLKDPDYWNDFYDHVQLQVERIVSMLNELGVATSKEDFVFCDAITLAEVISDATERWKDEIAEKEMNIEVSLEPDIPQMHVDAKKFRYLFELLLKDELITLAKGSRVQISARLVPAGATDIQRIEIIVEDNGPGLPKDALRSVFDPFFARRENPQEYGINLMACFFIIYHHGGTMDVSSQPGKGSRFTMNLPVRPQFRSQKGDDRDFISKILANDALWEKLLAGRW